MQPDILTDVVNIGGAALEEEDRQLCLAGKRWGQHIGLATLQNERLCQYIVWKALLKKYNAKIEHSFDGRRIDLRLMADREHLLEMKFWKNERADAILSDVERLQKFPNGGFVLVFSANPSHQTSDNVKHIASLPGIGGPPCLYSFASESEWLRPCEFWFAGWPVRPII